MKLFFLLLFISLKVNASAFDRHLYFCYVDVVSGPGFFGHAFLWARPIHSDKLSAGDYYTYSIQLPSEGELKFTNIFVYRSTSVRKKDKFAEAIRDYNLKENKSFYCRKLNLTDAEKESVVAILERETNQGLNYTDFTFDTNCTSKVIDPINDSVDKQKKINYWKNDQWYLYDNNLIHSYYSAIYNRFPFMFVWELNNHPLDGKEMLFFKSRKLQLAAAIDQFKKECHFKNNVEAEIDLVIENKSEADCKNEQLKKIIYNLSHSDKLKDVVLP